MNSLFTPLSATAPISSKPESDVPAEFESKGSCRGSMCVVAARPTDIQDEVPSDSESGSGCRGTFCVVA
jgi:hypothetical protein